MKNINNIGYTIEEYGIEFSFTYKDRGFMTAILQLPDLPDSQHSINSESYDHENGEQAEICAALSDYYYDDFTNDLCAKASAIIQNRVQHIEAEQGLYVAFCGDGSTHILKEGSATSYYNVFYLETVHKMEQYDQNGNEIFNDEKIIAGAQKSLFKDLKESLEKTLDAWVADWKDDGFCYAGDCESPKDMIKPCLDEALSEFMEARFDSDWEDNEVASEFYENIGCVSRICAEDAANAALELSEESQPSQS